MELISETYHTTMLEFLATLNEDTLDGVYTARLTPCKCADWMECANMQPKNIDNTVSQWLQTMTTPTPGLPWPGKTVSDCDPMIKKVLCFKESGAKVGVHYHFRFVTDYKSRKSIADIFKNYWKIPKGTGKGNAAYSVRDCKQKDKTIWKNATYIAKQGDCIYYHGYTKYEVDFFCKHAAKYQKMEGKPKWEQIMLWNEYKLKACLRFKTFTSSIIETVIAWHEVKNKDIPGLPAFRNIVHNISWRLNKHYRTGMINTIQNEFARKNRDEGYDHVRYEPPTEDLPDWENKKI